MAAAAQPLYRVNEKRRWIVGGTGRLFEAAAPYTREGYRRRRAPRTDGDTRNNVTEFGWRELLSASRYLYGNFGPIRGAMWQMVNYAVGQAFQVQYIGRNREWGNRMEEAVYEADKICDVRGTSYDFSTALKLDLLSIIRDGDCNVLLTETAGGWPQFQSIGAHRIQSVGELDGDGNIKTGPFAGRSIQNGVILDDIGRAIGYRVALGGEDFYDVAAGDMFQDYRPEFYDQARGIPWVSSAIYDAQDIADIRGYLKTALKAEASITLIEHNEAGAAMDVGSSILGGTATRNDDGTLTTTPTVEYFDDATVRYFRSGTDSKIEAPNSQRPSVQSQQFSFEILRGAFEALGWPIEFYDPSALGGANIRLRVAQAKRTLEGLQQIAKRIATRKHTYAIAKLIKLGVLPPDEDWWKIEHKAPRDLTVDNGRDTKADLELYRIGSMTLDELCARNGNYWEEVQDQKIREAKRLKERCAEAGVDIQSVQMLTPNGNAAAHKRKRNPMKNLSRVANIVSSVPWAIEPRALDFIAAVVDSHLAGMPAPQVEPQLSTVTEASPGIAIVPVRGPIIPRASMMSNISGATSSEEIAAAITELAADDSIRAIVLDIDSPGGSVLGGFEAADAIYAARQQKPVIACVSGVCASLAYLFASQASHVFATRGSHVGSIGVIARHYDDRAATHNAGYEEITVASSREKAMSGMTREEITAKMRAEVDRYFGMFKAAIARGRDVDMGAVATGEMWMADEALSRGLIDGIATPQEVISDAAKNLLLT